MCSTLWRLFAAIGILGSALLAQEPADLTTQMRSATGSNRFQIGELIPLEVAISSSSPNRYLEPCAPFWESHFGFPRCRFFSRWVFTITPAEGWVDLETEPPGSIDGFGGPTIEIPTADLSSKPRIYPYTLTHRFRFEKPGDYRVQLRMEVGLDDESTKRGPGFPQAPTKPNFVAVTGAITLELVPSSPEWQQKVISDGLRAYAAPIPVRSDPPSAEFLQYQQATDALCNLGTPEAVRVLMDLISPQHPEILGCFAHTPSVEAAIGEMERLIADPAAAINQQQFSALQLLVARLQQMKAGPWPTVEQTSEKLISSLPQKRGEAQRISLLTALRYPARGKATPFDAPHDLPFPDTVISLVVANYDQFPWESQQQILGPDWALVRSPLMLPLVRRLADAGNGQALLRWSELDPTPATDFMRQEVLRPVPRFSSYFLRLPDTELSEQQQAQLAANFVALTDNRALFNSATLLHRYASKAVLPVVLPFIDSKSGEWSDSVLFPALAYVLKVAPEEAKPRIGQLIHKTNAEPWQTTLFTDIGFLQPDAVLEQLALSQIDAGIEPLASDAAEYLRLHGSAATKPQLWKQLAQWNARLAKNNAEERQESNAAPDERYARTKVISDQTRLVADLRRTIVSAQAWVLTPEDADHLQSLLGEPSASRNTTIGPGPGSYAILIDHRHPIRSPNDGPEYMNPIERFQYVIEQYDCRDLRTLKEKLLQFPAGSSFSFSSDFSAADRAEIAAISDFLRDHGYKVNNAPDWPRESDVKN